MNTDFLNIFLPPRCAGCDDIIDRDFPVCDKCRKLIIEPADSKHRCDVCFLPHNKCICIKRQFYEKLSVSFFYEGEAKRTIIKFKFHARPDIAKNYSKLLYRSLKQRNMLEDTDIITFVPMSGFRQFRRGYNQSELLAKKLSEIAEIPCVGILRRSGKSQIQHSLRRSSRSGNLLGIFEPEKKYREEIKGKTILIVDDVYTTGSTLNEIAKTLLIFGADKVYAASCTTVKKQKKY